MSAFSAYVISPEAIAYSDMAIAANVKGYKFIAVVPDNYSQKRMNILRVYGAEVITSDSSQGNDSHILLVEKMVREHPEYKWLNQFTNEASVDAHYYGTGPEIVEQIMPDAFVASIGSAGTFQGIASYLKNINSNIKTYVVQPEGCDILNGKAIKHKIQGVSLGIKPPILNYSLIDGYIDIEYAEVRKEIDELVRKEGILLGFSSGQNIVAAKRIARELGVGKKVCTVAPDGGENYVDELICN